MTTVTILPVPSENGKQLYRAIAGDKHSTGTTAGQALDALTVQLGSPQFGVVLFIQSFQPDTFFSIDQQNRLAELMQQWREARDRGEVLSSHQQQELDALVEAELNAATARSATLLEANQA